MPSAIRKPGYDLCKGFWFAGPPLLCLNQIWKLYLVRELSELFPIFIT